LIASQRRSNLFSRLSRCGSPKWKRGGGANFVGIARHIGVHRPVSPEEVEVSRNHWKSDETIGLPRSHVSQYSLSESIIQHDLVGEIGEIPLSDRPGIPEQDQFARILTRWYFDGKQRGYDVAVEMKLQGVLLTDISGQAAKHLMVAIILRRR
jgi:hypothetical protein